MGGCVGETSGDQTGRGWMSETKKAGAPAAGRAQRAPRGWVELRTFLRANPQAIRDDADLLADLGLRIKADNIVDFGPAALARLSAAKTREKAARRELEATARANFAAQAQTHAAVVDILEARNHADLARRVDETARLRFGLVAGVVALERPGHRARCRLARHPWWTAPTACSAHSRLARMGEPRAAQSLFGELGEGVGKASPWSASPSGPRPVRR